ncbi:conserved membrane hypothetical protein [Vibrio chagasii]|nr:conserved membrane hypothetical protein [Vibrio chagasii]
MKKLLSLSIVSIICSCISFVFLPIISSRLSLESFGDYSFLYSVSSLLASVFLFGTNVSYSLAIANKDRNYAEQAIQMFVTINIVLGFFILFFSVFFVTFRGWELGVIFLPLFILGRSQFLVTSHYFRVHKQSYLFAAYQLSTWLLVFTIPIGVSFFVEVLSGTDFIAIMAVIMMVSGQIGIIVLKRRGYLDRVFVNPFKIPFFRFGLYASLHTLAAASITIIDRLIIVNFANKEVFAVYALGATLAAALSLVYSVVNQNMAPDFYARMKANNNSQRILFDVFCFYSFLILSLFVLYQISIGFIVEIFFSDEYLKAVGYARLISIGILFQGFYFFASSLLMYMNFSDKLFKMTLSVGSLSIISGLCSYYYYEIPGVIVNGIFVWLVYVSCAYFFAFKSYVKIKCS